MSILNTSPAKSTQQIKHLAFYSKLFACDPPTPQFYENLQVLPMGNVRHFRRIRKNDVPFLNMCVCRANLLNYLENLQVLPMGNVRHFRRIRENDIPFLKICVFH